MDKPKPTHTPGPWEVGGKDGTSILTAGRNLVARAITTLPYGEAGGIAAEQAAALAQANARLIAAAPDMLEAAKLVYQEGFTDSYCGFCERHAPKNDKGVIVGPLNHDDACIIEVLGVAIAKAEGGR